MTTVTPPRNPSGRHAVAEARLDRSTVTAGAISGWYDPDGAAWEADPAEAFEAFEALRASPRPARVDQAPERAR